MARPRRRPAALPRQWRSAPAPAVVVAVATVVLTAGCAVTGGHPEQAARPTAGPAPADAAGKRVGALFKGRLDGPRMCTASVVASPGHNLLVTAAHCVHTAERGTEDGLVFAPGYRDRQAPYGSWPVTSVVVDPRWADDEDPDYDVAFLTVGEVGGRRIEDAVGANRLATGLGFGLEVTVTGYPNESAEPVSCLARTTSLSPTQERFDCAGYTDGTSGSPWVTGGDRLVGVIGGHEEGGLTPDTSYSITFDDRVAAVYREATS
ncbi:hypothetical protein GCM10010441_16420 [Kitasatospora paracochleata]|uniref:V8-like Glu-specific endopeptidase n=1 Tax=Kitasatospora paracochleata TaxID=58354 RepID=A0ABT1IZA4_9ACTN|nr:trypsin-like peptidase domain-containing protein [Kitasatospora paracochleata]MCP2310495.1 V8-like Glu-specific endopeptidase [Kitasatospora paracochleata]